jgi:hypothetical protein
MQNQTNLFIFKLSFLLVLSTIISCQKQKLENDANLKISHVSKNNAMSVTGRIGFIAEQVDHTLLQKYVNYKSVLEKEALIEKFSGIHAKSQAPKMNKKEIQTMLDNFLANERNIMRSDAIRNKAGSAVNFEQRKSTDTLPPPANPFVSCVGTVDATTSGVIFAATYSGTGGSLSTFSFGFTGISGTMTPIGGLSQSYYNGVITYQQIFSDTYIFSGTNVSYTQAYIIYGNVYNGGCTVHGMKYLPN